MQQKESVPRQQNWVKFDESGGENRQDSRNNAIIVGK